MCIEKWLWKRAWFLHAHYVFNYKYSKFILERWKCNSVNFIHIYDNWYQGFLFLTLLEICKGFAFCLEILTICGGNPAVTNGFPSHFRDVMMSTIASKITSLAIVYSTVYSGTDERKHQSSASLAFVRGIHRWPVNSPHKGPVTRKMFPFDDVIM